MSPGNGPGAGRPETTDEHPVSGERLLTRHLLLDDGRRERVEHEARTRHPPVGEATPRVGDDVVVGLEPRGVVLLAEQGRYRLEQPRGPRSPRLRVDLRVAGTAHEMQRAHALGRLDRPRHRTLVTEPRRRVARTPAEDPELGAERDLAAAAPATGRRFRHHTILAYTRHGC